MTGTTVSYLTKAISDLLRMQGLAPDAAQIAALVQAHYDGFVDRLLAAYGLGSDANTRLRDYVHSMDDVHTMEFVVRHHAAIVEKLRQEADAEVLL